MKDEANAGKRKGQRRVLRGAAPLPARGANVVEGAGQRNGEPAARQRGSVAGSSPHPANGAASSHGRVLEHLVERGPTTRRVLASLTGLTQPTITRIIQDFMEHDLVREGKRAELPGAGRRPNKVELIADSALALGIHIRASHVEMGLVSLAGKPVVAARFPFRDASPEQVADTVRDTYRRLLDEAGVLDGRILGAGVGTAGVVDRTLGRNRFAFNLYWKDVPLRELLAERLGLPVVLATNTHAMAVAERRFGIGRQGVRNFLFFLVGSGVGSAVVLDGRLHHGKGVAGEIGHTSVDPDGPACPCGGRGCLETFVADRATLATAERLLREHRAGHAPFATVEALVAAEASWPPALAAHLASCGSLIGTSLAHAADLLDLDAIVVSGALFDAAPVLDALRERLATASLAGRLQTVVVSRSHVGADIGLVGSASLVLDPFFQAPLLPPGGRLPVPAAAAGAPL